MTSDKTRRPDPQGLGVLFREQRRRKRQRFGQKSGRRRAGDPGESTAASRWRFVHQAAGRALCAPVQIHWIDLCKFCQSGDSHRLREVDGHAAPAFSTQVATASARQRLQRPDKECGAGKLPARILAYSALRLSPVQCSTSFILKSLAASSSSATVFCWLCCVFMSER